VTLAEDRWSEGLRVLRRLGAVLHGLAVWDLLPRHFRLPRTKRVRGRVLAALLAAALPALANDAPPKIEWQRGPCRGHNQPSCACKTCLHCAYCSPKRWNGTCVVCQKARATSAAVAK
jgi:hypothetical protein